MKNFKMKSIFFYVFKWNINILNEIELDKQIRISPFCRLDYSKGLHLIQWELAMPLWKKIAFGVRLVK